MKDEELIHSENYTFQVKDPYKDNNKFQVNIKGNGQHKDCDVCNIESIKDEKRTN